MLLFVSKKTASECLNLSGSTLKKYRLQGDWIEGIHWVRLNSRCVRYNLELIKDWLHNRGNPKAHLRAIETYQQNLLSYQKATKALNSCKIDRSHQASSTQRSVPATFGSQWAIGNTVFIE